MKKPYQQLLNPLSRALRRVSRGNIIPIDLAAKLVEVLDRAVHHGGKRLRSINFIVLTGPSADRRHLAGTAADYNQPGGQVAKYLRGESHAGNGVGLALAVQANITVAG